MEQGLLPIVFLLLLVFQIKHFLSDFIAQLLFTSVNDQLGKFKENDWIVPLSNHCFDGALITFCVSIIFTLNFSLSLLLFIVDFTVHFLMDRLKASPFMWGRYKYPSSGYFISLGFDQMIHHITHYVIIFVIVTNLGF